MKRRFGFRLGQGLATVIAASSLSLFGCTAAQPVRSARTVDPQAVKMQIQAYRRVARMEWQADSQGGEFQEPSIPTFGAEGIWGFKHGIELGIGLKDIFGFQGHAKKSLLGPQGTNNHFAALLLEGGYGLGGGTVALGLAYSHLFPGVELTLMGRSGYASEYFANATTESHTEVKVEGVALDAGLRLGLLFDKETDLAGAIFVMYRHMDGAVEGPTQYSDYRLKTLGPSVIFGFQFDFLAPFLSQIWKFQRLRPSTGANGSLN